MALVTMASPLGEESSSNERRLSAPLVRRLACRRYLRLCQRFLCAALLWNFLAVAVLHEPTESP